MCQNLSDYRFPSANFLSSQQRNVSNIFVSSNVVWIHTFNFFLLFFNFVLTLSFLYHFHPPLLKQASVGTYSARLGRLEVCRIPLHNHRFYLLHHYFMTLLHFHFFWSVFSLLFFFFFFFFRFGPTITACLISSEMVFFVFCAFNLYTLYVFHCFLAPYVLFVT